MTTLDPYRQAIAPPLQPEPVFEGKLMTKWSLDDDEVCLAWAHGDVESIVLEVRGYGRSLSVANLKELIIRAERALEDVLRVSR